MTEEVVIGDPVPGGIRRELERLGERWRMLPLDRALRHAPALREVADECAAQLPGIGGAHARVHDLGPACALDQLTVLVYDLCAHRVHAPDGVWATSLAARLAAARAALG